MELTKKSLGTAIFAEEGTEQAEKGHVRAVVCTYGVVDKDNDVVQKGAIPDGSTVILSAYNHSAISGATLPVGKGVIRDIGNEAVLEGEFFMDTAAGRDAFRTVKSLAASGLGEWSWGFFATEQEPGEFEGKSVNFIKATKTFEASFVAVGAGVGTRTIEAKASKPDGQKFSDEGAAVLAALKSYRTRAADVLALRQGKGKSLSDESIETIKSIALEVSELISELTNPQVEETNATTEHEDDVEKVIATIDDDAELDENLAAFLTDIMGDEDE